MGLTDLWNASRDQLEGKHVSQIIAFAGSGQLRDGGDASIEFRQFLSLIPSDFFIRYVDECLTGKFEGSGLALQDIVNQVGRRLGFEVTDGRYRGGGGQLGHDGLWRSPEGHALVVEVKTTDAYRFDLNVFAGYRRTLIRAGEVFEDRSSILIVVGREDTGGLEAQIRGSRHAWDVRLISVEALLRLMRLKEDTEKPHIHQQIRSILIPHEFTKLDGIIDLVFVTAEDVRQEGGPPDDLPATDSPEDSPGTDKRDRKPKFTPVSFHDACASRIQAHLGRPLLRRSRAIFSSPDGGSLVVCAVSREHERGGTRSYWFAFHPHQREALAAASEGFVAFGCGSEKTIILIPFDTFGSWLDGLWTTELEDRFYWHVRIHLRDGRFTLDRKRGLDPVDLTPYVLGGAGKDYLGLE